MEGYQTQTPSQPDQPEDQLSEVTVHTGFPNPAADADRHQASLSLDRLLLSRPSSTYMFRLHGHSWSDEGIAPGDIAVVDRAATGQQADLIVTWIDDEFAIMRRRSLPTGITAWGKVTAIVHLYE